MANRSDKRPVRFLLNGHVTEVEGEQADTSLLDWLRRARRLTGTKEGCAEGDCGACSLLLARRGADGQVSRQAVNGCILFLPMIDGCAITTIEGVAGPDGSLHPVQQAMISNHASQCGFCTPGFVMSLVAGWQSGCDWTDQSIEDLLAGNLCRCTGYGPIMAAGRSLAGQPRPDWEQARLEAEADWLAQAAGAPLAYDGAGQPFYAPTDIDSLSWLIADNPSVQIVAGATDIGLWVTKQHRDLPGFVSVMAVPELQQIKKTKTGFEIGAAVTHSRAAEQLAGDFPALSEIWRRFGSAQVRASGTVGGNIANGSPIGDLAPCFLALGGELILQKGAAQRRLPLDAFFLDYAVQDRQPGEWLRAVWLPRLEPGAYFQAMKISRRFDQDISAVLGAFWLDIKDGHIAAARIGFGGMAAVPSRARACEAALAGAAINAASLARAQAALLEDFNPISDMRASADYRRIVAGNLLAKVFCELETGKAPRLAGDGLAGLQLGQVDGTARPPVSGVSG